MHAPRVCDVLKARTSTLYCLVIHSKQDTPALERSGQDVAPSKATHTESCIVCIKTLDAGHGCYMTLSLAVHHTGF